MSGRARVCLVFPRFRYVSGDPPLGLGYLARALDARAQVTIVDGAFCRSIPDACARIEAARPDLVGIYFDTIMFDDGVEIARFARSKGWLTVAGGPHATVLPDTLVQEVDAVALGEAEATIAEIVEHLPRPRWDAIAGLCYDAAGRSAYTPARGHEADLDALGYPDRWLFDMERYLGEFNYFDAVERGVRGTTIVASRGCPFNCAYCQPTLRRMFGREFRVRSVASVMDEIRCLHSDFRVRGIFFHDDTLTAWPDWVRELCDELRRADLGIIWGCNARVDTLTPELLADMRAAGLRKLHLGIESATDHIVRDVYGKGITFAQARQAIDWANAADVAVLGFFILGAPGETPAELRRTVAAAVMSRLDEATFSICSPVPGTLLHERLRLAGQRLSRNFADYNYYSTRGFSAGGISAAGIKLWQLAALFCFYLHPRRWRYILGHFCSWRGAAGLLTKVRRYLPI